MSRKVKIFYEVQQKTGHNWSGVGFFRTKKAAEEYMKTFNTKTVVYPIRVIEREFLG